MFARLWRFLKWTAKWTGIFVGIYLVASMLGAVDFERRMGWVIFGLALSVGYVHSSLKDRIDALEMQMHDLRNPRGYYDALDD